MAKRLHVRNNKGETLLEMLVSVLVGALATSVLATTIAHSVIITNNIDDFDETMKSDIKFIESRAGFIELDSETVTNPPSGTITIGSSDGVSVNYYGNGRMMAFEVNETEKESDE